MTRTFYDRKTGRRFEVDAPSDERKVSIGYRSLERNQSSVMFLLGVEATDVVAKVAQTIAAEEAQMIEDRTGIEVDAELFGDMESRARARLTELT